MYQVNIENGYIISVVSGVSNGNITEEEYNQIISIFNNRPTAPEGHEYRLRDNLTWELVELPDPEPEPGPEPEPDPEPSLAEEILNILLGDDTE